MFGAFIGDIVGSKYEFDNIKTKRFPLFSPDCDYTDDTIMTVAMAKAILLRLRDKNIPGRSFQDYLIEVMQDFGRRYPTPTGAYGGHFAQWLREKDPKPYGSYGNGSAMRVSPCALMAVTMEEALSLARASACVSHDHPEGVKGAEAVSAAIFLAKCGKSKEEIRQYISQHYYNLDFTLDSIRANYQFDGSCQGSVPQAIVAFLESESFEDAIRNIISIGGDCDTTGAITGSIAWVFYADYTDWVQNRYHGPMGEIKAQATAFLPQEFIDIAEEFHKDRGLRAAAFERIGFCRPVLSQQEIETYVTHWAKPAAPYRNASTPLVTTEMRDAMAQFCNKYVVLMELLYRDQALNQWCHNYSNYRKTMDHIEIEKMIHTGFLKDAYQLRFFSEALSWKPYSAYSLKAALQGTETDLIHGICWEIRSDYIHNGSLISHAIANGNLYRLMQAFLSYKSPTQYNLEYIKQQTNRPDTKTPGACSVRFDTFLKKWHLKFQLDESQLWYLSVFVQEDGTFEKFSLDNEAANDSHYEFVEEERIRESLCSSNTETQYFHQILMQYVRKHGGNALRSKIMPYVNNQHHFY